MSGEFTVGKGCMSVVLGIFAFIIIATILVFGGCAATLVALFHNAPRIEETSHAVATPSPIPSRPIPTPPPARQAPGILTPGATVVTTQPVRLTGEHGTANLPAGARVELISIDADTATISRAGLTATAPLSTLQPDP